MQLGLIGFIVVIVVICALFNPPEKFQRLLYILAAVLVLMVVLSIFWPGADLRIAQ